MNFEVEPFQIGKFPITKTNTPFFALASYPEAILAKEYLKPYKTMPRKYLIARTLSTGLSRAKE